MTEQFKTVGEFKEYLKKINDDTPIERCPFVVTKAYISQLLNYLEKAIVSIKDDYFESGIKEPNKQLYGKVEGLQYAYDIFKEFRGY